MMVKLKPCTCRTQCLPSISDHPLPFPISKSNINSSLYKPIFLRLSYSHPIPTRQPIVCARRRGWFQPSNRKMLQLASMVAFNLKILPEPFNSLVGEIARGESNGARPEYSILNRLVGGWKGKLSRRRRGNKLVWFLLLLICCVAGLLWTCRVSISVSEWDLFVRALLFFLAGISLIRLWRGKKAIKEWFLGVLFGIVLVISSRLGKEEVKFWVQKLRTCSPVAQIAMRKRTRSRSRRISK